MNDAMNYINRMFTSVKHQQVVNVDITLFYLLRHAWRLNANQTDNIYYSNQVLLTYCLILHYSVKCYLKYSTSVSVLNNTQFPHKSETLTVLWITCFKVHYNLVNQLRLNVNNYLNELISTYEPVCLHCFVFNISKGCKYFSHH